MLELYSTNIEVAENASIPLNNIGLSKGTTAVHSAPASIELNKSGVYMVACHASAAIAAAGTVGIQLVKNNTPVLNAISVAAAPASSSTALGFETLVQVRDSNTCCCNTAPTTLQVQNIGPASTFSIANVVITKVC